MGLRIIWLLVIGGFFIVVFASSFPQGLMTNTIQSIPVSVASVIFAGEVNEISLIVDEFMVLRQMGPTQEAQAFAEQLDERINKLELVKMNCVDEISTFDLVSEKNPYAKLQEICPSLKDISFGNAVQLFGTI